MTVTEMFGPRPDYDGKPVPELLELVRNERASLSRRASAVASLGRRSAVEPAAVAALESIATDATMRETRMFHLVSLAYLAVAGLLNGRTDDGVEAARRALDGFDEGDRESLESWLRSGGLLVP